MSKRRVLIFTRFERLWHWSQMALIMTLLVTGFAVHGLHQAIGFEVAVTWHTAAALALLLLWAFATFWLFTTGTWRHFLPTQKGLWSVARYYAFGIFKGEHHPYKKLYRRKHNPLQALAYLGLKVVLFPAIWISGLLYLGYGLWGGAGSSESLMWIAVVHTAAAFAILAFVITHVYLLTTGHSFREHVMPMVNGFDEVELTPEEEAYLEHDEPGKIR